MLSAVTAQFKFEEEQIAEDKRNEEERINKEARKLAGLDDEPEELEEGENDVKMEEGAEINDATTGDSTAADAATTNGDTNVSEYNEGVLGGQDMETTIDGEQQQEEVKIEGKTEES